MKSSHCRITITFTITVTELTEPPLRSALTEARAGGGRTGCAGRPAVARDTGGQHRRCLEGVT